MDTWINRPREWLKAFHGSIAYLPTLLSAGYVLLAAFAVTPRFDDVIWPELLEVLQFNENDTPRALLSTLTAGMISLMVFSFSMVMSILTQAGANFSHKLLTGLITERHHQWVLGHYLGTLLFILILLIVPDPNTVPSFWRSAAIYLAVLMAVHCLALFIYFIHQASQSVQINAVTHRLKDRTQRSLGRLREQAATAEFATRPPPPSCPGVTLHATRSGHVQGVDFQALLDIAVEHALIIHLEFTQGTFVVAGMPVFRVETPADSLTEEQRERICAALIFLNGEVIEEHYVHGLTQLMEVAIKALSPGINDPGTARLCLHQLTELLGERLTITPSNSCIDSHGATRVTWPTEPFDALLYRVLGPILHYGRDDLSICLAVIDLLKTLSRLSASPDVIATLQGFADKALARVAVHVRFPIDETFVSHRLDVGDHRLALALPRGAEYSVDD